MSGSKVETGPSKASGSRDNPEPDRITLRDHVVETEIGAFQEERGRKQRVRFNLVAELAQASTDTGDDVDEILSYDVLVQAIEDELGAGRVNLLETLADGIAGRILSHRGVDRAHVAIEKLDRSSGALGVAIVRDRSTAPAEPGLQADRARVVFLDLGLLSGARLAPLIDELAASGGAILCVEAVVPAPRASNAPVQRRLDLLQIEQAAWLLADRDARCIVMGSRTELEWAQRQHKIAVWAPSKLVLDSREAPTDDARALARWLAELLQAGEVEFPGGVAGA